MASKPYPHHRKNILFLLLIFPVFVDGYLLVTQQLKNNSLTTQSKTRITSNIADELSEKEYLETDTLLAGYVDRDDPQVALNKLSDLMNIDPKVERSCHGLVHDIGHAAYAKYKTFSKAISFQDDLCGSGYLHGVIEAYFKSSVDLLSAMKTVCQGSESEEGKCYHGVGHGIMYFNSNNVPGAIQMCDTYKSSFAKVTCSEGVFMENFNSYERFHPSKFLDPDNPFYPCHEQANLYKYSCYFYAPDYFLKLHPRGYTEAITWCNSAEKDFVVKCFNGLGSRMTKQNLGSPTFVEKICMSAGQRDKIDSCIDGMTSYLLVNYNSTSRVQAICTTLREANRPACVHGVRIRSHLYAT